MRLLQSRNAVREGGARPIRRGLQNMRIQAFLTAAAVNLKRLATALCALLDPHASTRLLLGLLATVATVARRRATDFAHSASARAA